MESGTGERRPPPQGARTASAAGGTPSGARKRRRVEPTPPAAGACHYETLRVHEGASSKQIHSAYLRRSRELHPDKNPARSPSAPAELVNVQEAFRVLGEQRTRDAYDLTRAQQDVALPEARGHESRSPERSPRSCSTADTIVSAVARRSASGGSADSGSRAAVESIRCMFRGVLRDLDRMQKECTTFSVTSEQVRAAAEQAVYVPCTLSDLFCGAVKDFQFLSTQYHASGEMTTSRQRLSVRVEPGWPHGTRVRFPGVGDTFPDGSRGDVAVVVHELPDPTFLRRGHDLIHSLRLDRATAAAGAAVRVRMPDATVLVATLPPTTTPAVIAAARGYGMPAAAQHGARGSLLITVAVGDVAPAAADAAADAADAAGAAPAVPPAFTSATPVVDITSAVTLLAPDVAHR